MDLVYADGYIELPLGSITLDEYTNINPDMKGNVKRLLAFFRRVDSKPPTTVKQFLRRVLGGQSMRANAVLLTMWLCFAGDSSITQECIDKGVDAWRKAAREYKALNKLSPLCAVVAQGV